MTTNESSVANRHSGARTTDTSIRSVFPVVRRCAWRDLFQHSVRFQSCALTTVRHVESNWWGRESGGRLSHPRLKRRYK
jgi:hypothetical protein